MDLKPGDEDFDGRTVAGHTKCQACGRRVVVKLTVPKPGRGGRVAKPYPYYNCEACHYQGLAKGRAGEQLLAQLEENKQHATEKQERGSRPAADPGTSEVDDGLGDFIE